MEPSSRYCVGESRRHGHVAKGHVIVPHHLHLERRNLGDEGRAEIRAVVLLKLLLRLRHRNLTEHIPPEPQFEGAWIPTHVASALDVADMFYAVSFSASSFGGEWHSNKIRILSTLELFLKILRPDALKSSLDHPHETPRVHTYQQRGPGMLP